MKLYKNPVTGEITKGGTVKIPFGKGLTLDLSGLTNYPTGKTISTTEVTGRPAAMQMTIQFLTVVSL